MKTKPTSNKRALSISKALFFTAALAGTTTDVLAQACDAGTFNMPNISAVTCTGKFYDTGGSGGNYQNNESRTFNVAPTDATSVTVKFTAFDTEASYDVLTVYERINAGGNVLGTFSGSSIPSTLTSNYGEMSFVFTSDGSVTKSGWSAVWTSIGGVCGASYNIPAQSVITPKGTLNDSGGPSANYTNSENKMFNIAPTDATFVCLKFNTFNTEASYDIVRVYSGLNGSGPLLGTYSGTSIPSDITSTTGKMSITFTSDGSVVSSGWTSIWTSDGTARIPMTGIEDAEATEGKISISPNPVAGDVRIGFTVKESGAAKVTLYNVAGIETMVLDKNLSAGDHTIDFDASLLAPGVYFCRVITGSSVLVEKLVKN